MADTPTEKFWRFSLAFYAAPEVQSACLALQDDHGADVNVVLFMLFHGHRGQCLDADAVAAVEAGVAAWRSGVVQPLRALRRRLKAQPYPLSGDAQEAFRSVVKSTELQAEKAQQAHMETLHVTTQPAAPDAAARTNLTLYAAQIGLAADHPALETLLSRLADLPTDV